MAISKKKTEFNNFRFEGLNWRQYSNKYMTMDRVSADGSKIVVKVSDVHLLPTKYGFALILDDTHVVFLKSWQVNSNYYGNEVILQKDFWNVKEWGNFEDFGPNEENYKFETWMATAKEQDDWTDEDGFHLNPVRWEI